jgi:DNA helicase-2/ATP-dependent DNA helicase PcrA
MEDEVSWPELERFATALKLFKKSRMLVDFTDMLERLVESTQDFLPELDLLIVDEVQDLSPLQWRMVERLAAKAGRTYVGGDDLQSIYNWSGADVARFISLPGEQTTLEQSYRIPSSVHKLASSISDRIQNKRPRRWKPREEIGSVNWFSDISEVDLSKDTWLILARNGYHLKELEDHCLQQGFSFHSVGRDPLRSPSLPAIKTWETLRRGGAASGERVLEVLVLMPPQSVPIALVKQLKSDDSGQEWTMADLIKAGIGTTAIWHEALTKISPRERDYFIAARRRGEALLKEPRIRISTVHAAKGAECDHTLLMTDISYRCSQNMERSYDDECRVFYVGATRCKKSLNIIMPKTNLFFDL